MSQILGRQPPRQGHSPRINLNIDGSYRFAHTHHTDRGVPLHTVKDVLRILEECALQNLEDLGPQEVANL